MHMGSLFRVQQIQCGWAAGTKQSGREIPKLSCGKHCPTMLTETDATNVPTTEAKRQIPYGSCAEKKHIYQSKPRSKQNSYWLYCTRPHTCLNIALWRGLMPKPTITSQDQFTNLIAMAIV